MARRGVVGYGTDGRRIRRKVSGRTKQEVRDKLTELYGDLEVGIRRPDSRYTVAQAVADWLAEGLDGRSEKTVALNRHVLQPVVNSIGRVALRDLTTRDVRRVHSSVAATKSSRTVVVTHNVLERAVRHAEANDYVRRNVAALVGPPTGQQGRPSRSLTMDQAAALMGAAEGSRLGAYVVLCLLAGVRTEEARAHGDTRTGKSRRTLALPGRAVEALREHRRRQAEQRLLAGGVWQDPGAGVLHRGGDTAGCGERAPIVQEDHRGSRAR